MTELHISSTSLIYSPGLFFWIEKAIMPFQKRKAKELLLALGIPADCVKAIMQGKYTSKEQGDTLILTVEA